MYEGRRESGRLHAVPVNVVTHFSAIRGTRMFGFAPTCNSIQTTPCLLLSRIFFSFVLFVRVLICVSHLGCVHVCVCMMVLNFFARV